MDALQPKPPGSSGISKVNDPANSAPAPPMDPEHARRLAQEEEVLRILMKGKAGAAPAPKPPENSTEPPQDPKSPPRPKVIDERGSEPSLALPE